MPSRKSGGSTDEQQSDRRASLRRLSSIASLHNIFARRRSNPNGGVNTTLASSSSASDLSLTSAVANAPIPLHKQFASSTGNLLETIQTADGGLQEQPGGSTRMIKANEDEYTSLPSGDSAGALPRSRTFSNLPLPTRLRRPTPSAVAQASQVNKPHARHQSTSKIPPTRLPSPPASSRRHISSRLPSAGHITPLIPGWARLPRSDTEPLLKIPVEQPAATLPRSTALKENISLSPVKSLPPLSMVEAVENSFGSNCGFPGEKELEHGVENDACVPLLIGDSKENRCDIGMVKSYSSPGGVIEKPKRSLPRGSSQPMLTNITNRRNSQYGEIKQVRLMSARHAPTPPPLKALVTAESTKTNRHHSRTASTSRIAQPVKATSRQPSSFFNHKPDNKPSTPQQTHLQVTAAEPLAYWSGRLSSLADAYRNAELTLHLAAGAATNKTETDKMHTSEATTARLHRVLARLHEVCATPEARESLVVFQKVLAERVKVPELAKVGPAGAAQSSLRSRWGFGGSSGSAEKGVEKKGSKVLSLVVGKEEEDNEQQHWALAAERGDFGGISEARKVKFMDRLLGRQRKGGLPT